MGGCRSVVDNKTKLNKLFYWCSDYENKSKDGKMMI